MMTTETEERKHHLYSPSSLQMREACACFDNRQSSNEAAVTGTKQHAVTETGQDDESLGDEQALHAAECLDFYEKHRQILLDERAQAQSERDALQRTSGAAPAGELPDVLELCEAYLAVDDLKFNDTVLNPDGTRATQLTEATTAGYVDRALVSWDRKKATLLDWKFGAWTVTDTKENLQAISYALGLVREYPTLESIKFIFKLPQLGEVLEATFTRDEFPSLYLRVQTVVARAREAHRRMLDDDFSMATPHVPACNFCAHIGTCPKIAEFACKVGHKFHPVEIPSDLTPTGLKTGEDASIGIRLSQVLAVWCKAFRGAVSDRVIRGDAPLPPGFRVEQRADREVVDDAKFKQVVLTHLTKDELDALAKYAFGAIEKLISDKAPRGSKKAAVEEFQDQLIAQGAVKRGSPYSFLKACSDKKE